jgi:hypothetical protein
MDVMSLDRAAPTMVMNASFMNMKEYAALQPDQRARRVLHGAFGKRRIKIAEL